MIYKGIDKAKINEIEKVKLPYKKECFELDFSKLEESGVNKMMQELIETQRKKEEHDTDMYIICEMAKKYLDTLDKQIHINDVVYSIKYGIKGVVLEIGKEFVTVYSTEGNIYTMSLSEITKTGETIDVINTIWGKIGG